MTSSSAAPPRPGTLPGLSRRERGALVARVLRGAWRPSPPPCEVSEVELAETLTPLLRSGSAPLAWWAIGRGTLAATAAGEQLHEVYRLAALQAAARRVELRALVRRLSAAGLDPVFGKGWVAAALYPEPGLRPFGDFDLYVPRGTGPSVTRALAAVADLDVHDGFAQLADRGERDVLARTRVGEHAGEPLRAFAEEDHLRLLCLHFLGHGAWRPAWLCDIAAALERRAAGFDWDRLLSGDARRTDWTLCAIVLAHELLEARLDGAPERVRARRLPAWLAPTVLGQWGHLTFEAQGLRVPLARELRRPRALVRALARRWPNAIEASVGVGAAFDDWPRLPVRLAEAIRRTGAFVARSLRDQAG